MKTMIVYSSRTGNTRRIARAILEALPKDTEIYPVEEAPSPEDYDRVIIGFWVDKGVADDRAREYMAGVRAKEVGIFATLGAEPDSKHALDVMVRTRELLAGNRICGEFVCQGRIDPALIEAMQSSGAHPMTPERKRRHEEAKNHPDEEDCRKAQAVFRAVFKQD
jgi:hypothetical protein